jgi:diacylglycerol kinase family enzyme
VPRIAVIANCSAGAGVDEQARMDEVRRAFAATGVRPDVACVPGAGLEAAARRALRSGASVVVAAGGDGTVNAVASAVAGTATPMAVLPLGTLNHFARDAGIPTDLEEAAAVAVAGRAQPIDVAEVNGRVFVNNSSIGAYPRAVRERERRHSLGGKRLATLGAAWRVLRRLPTHHVTLALDGLPLRRTTSFVFVGNNLYETGFGRLGRRASLADGRLGVYHVQRPGRRAILGLAANAIVGRLPKARFFEADEATRLVIRSPRRQLRVALDGEVLRLRTPLEYRIRPRSLLVMRPRSPP